MSQIGDDGINKEILSDDTLRASTEEIQEGCDLSGELIELEGFDSYILIETFQNTSVDSGIPSHEGTHAPVDEKSDRAPSDADLSSVHVGAVAVNDEAAECDDLQTSQEMVPYS
ncbi:hypothetical protein K7X08_011965 [Anisodus acutangulus]|uniref:Uncharacterized protein n=1 Tax=Anisodus acutangulus TaxID=402998 RepID=A0A9Q1QY63_9SOLA|nr:hypothetical protein K7X08_011965 [Anisodus acutangulus]